MNWLIYILVLGMTLYAMESIDFSRIFRKNRVMQVRVMYLLIALSITYLASSFLIEFLESADSWY